MSISRYLSLSIIASTLVLSACTGTNETDGLTAALSQSASTTGTSGSTSGVLDQIPPTMPTNLKTTTVTSSFVQIQWDSSSDNIGVSGYKIYRNSALVASVDQPTYLDADISANTTYSYSIVAFDAENNTSTGGIIAVTTPLAISSDTVPPTAPGNLRTSSSPTDSNVSLAWDAASDNVGVSGYRIYRSGSFLGSTNATTYNDTTVSAASSYVYVVMSYDAANNSAASSAMSVTTPAAADTQAPSVPGGLTVQSTTFSSINLQWNNSSDNVAVTGYHVYRNGSLISNTTTSDFSDTTVQASTSYQYTVSAYDAAGNTSSQASAITATTPADTGNYGTPYTDANFDSIMGNNQIYMAPAGTDSGSCTQSAPCRTFEYAVSRMSPGDGLILLDGDYSLAVNGGLRSTTESGNPIAKSAQLKAGVDVNHPTIVRALNPGNVFIEGGFTLGTKTQKVQYVMVYGLTFFTHSSLRNADYSVVKATGVYAGLSIGTIDHSMGCVYNLIEDVWIWGKNQRGNAVNYSAHHNIWRRVIIRDDGCDVLYCGEGAGNLKISATIYNSHDVTFENMISIDKILRANTYGTGSYSDFATAQHDSYRNPYPPEGEQNGRNSWLGDMVINSEDYAINFEAGEVLPLPETTGTIRDFVALNSRAGATIDGAGCPYNSASKYDIDNVYLFSVSGNSIYSGCSSNYVWGSNINTGSYTSNMSSGRVPQNQYGTSTPLWPWPYEARIHHDICVRGDFAGDGDEFPSTGIRATKSFCTSGMSLSNYIASF